jgi:hypothetical protein
MIINITRKLGIIRAKITRAKYGDIFASEIRFPFYIFINYILLFGVFV